MSAPYTEGWPKSLPDVTARQLPDAQENDGIVNFRIPVVPLSDANGMREALIGWAIPTMQREMRSDETTDAPYNEDMAEAIAACFIALGMHEEATEWHRPYRSETHRLLFGASGEDELLKADNREQSE